MAVLSLILKIIQRFPYQRLPLKISHLLPDAFTTAHEAYDYARTHDKKNEDPQHYSSDLLSHFLALNGMRARTTSGTIAVERGETFNYSGMETINWTIPLNSTVNISIKFPTNIVYKWNCSGGNPGNFYSSSSTTASVLANSSSTSPIVNTKYQFRESRN